MLRLSKVLFLPAAVGLMLGSGFTDAAHAGNDSEALALISVNARDGGIDIVASALALRAGEFAGEMVIERKGASGSVSTRQGRALTLATGEKGDIARVSLSHEAGDGLAVTVTLTRNGETIARATLTTHGK